MPTIFELKGMTLPVQVNGVPQDPMNGISMAYTFDDAKAKTRRTTHVTINPGDIHSNTCSYLSISS